MNCQQGDIAIVVHGERLGAMVECLRFQGYYEAADGSHGSDCWYVRSLCSYRFHYADGPKENGYQRDSSLRPICNRNSLDIERTKEITA